MCVENTNEMSTTINTSFNVQDVMKNIQAMMQEEKERAASSDTDKLISDLSEHLKTIKSYSDKLNTVRKKIIWSK